MKDFLGLLEYRRIFPSFLSISFAFYFIFLKDKFYLKEEFNTTLFLTAVILTSFTLSFLWRFFALGKKIINWKCIRVYVDFALKHNPQSVNTKNKLNEEFKPIITEFQNWNDDKLEELVTKIINRQHHTMFIIFGIKIQYRDNDGNTIINLNDFRKFAKYEKLLTTIYKFNYDEGVTLIKENKIETIDDDYNSSYCVEVEVSKINTGKKFEDKKYLNKISHLARGFTLDGNGKIPYKNRLEQKLIVSKEFNIIKNYKRPVDWIYKWEYSLATLRWYDLDYKGNKYTKLEERIAKKLEEKPALIIALTISIVILLIAFISFLLIKYFLPILILSIIGISIFLMLNK